MPYDNIQQLPTNVAKTLPKHAQEIYLAAFNHAYDTYADAYKRRAHESREAVAHKVAWGAVKNKYTKNGTWHKK